MSSHPNSVAILIPNPMRQEILSPAAEALLHANANIVSHSEGRPTADDLPELLQTAAVAITGWGSPPLPPDIMTIAPNLKLVAHTAGSIHHLVPADAITQGLVVSHAAAIIADSVAEIVIGQTLRFLRHLDDMDRAMKSGESWTTIRDTMPGRLLGSQTVGIVGTGHVGRTVIARLRAFGVTILAVDPFLTEDVARDLGVIKSSLEQMLAQSDIVSLHAPALPETTGMIGKAELQTLRNGALLINMSRGALVDEPSLISELETGRISAILDVFAQEPLSLESPLRNLPNVFLSPHAAGHTADTHKRQGQAMVEEAIRLLNGESLQFTISPQALATMA